MAKFKKIVIVDTAGISSMYANNGGVILCGIKYLKIIKVLESALLRTFCGKKIGNIYII